MSPSGSSRATGQASSGSLYVVSGRSTRQRRRPLLLTSCVSWSKPGERATDLYAGVGLFALALADAVGTTGAVLAIESDARAFGDAKANLRAHPEIELRRGKVDRVLKPLVRQEIHSDLVVLDPPRTGAGKSVIKDIAALRPRAVAYVACDPAALARDVAYARNVGYGIRSLRAFDAFPMTHHVECIAILEPLT